MIHTVFGIVERISPRPCRQTATAGSQSKLTAASSLLRQHTRRDAVRAGAATSGRNFASVCWNYSYYTLLAIAIIALSVYCVGVGYIISKNLHQTYTHWVETNVSKNLPQSEVDWVEAGVVSPVVRKQKNCGSCWAMAVVGSVEALHYLHTNQSITLSVQELIDCDKKNTGCKGGWPHVAFEYIVENGISTEISYPDMSGSSIHGCNLRKTAAARISDFRLVEPTEDALEEAVAKQPVIVNLQYVAGLWSYRRGIIDYKTLPPTLPAGNAVRTHSVLIVGYGRANGVKYWRFKNSWGKAWGEGGFGRIRRHVADKQGVLGMFKDSAKAVYPVLNM